MAAKVYASAAAWLRARGVFLGRLRAKIAKDEAFTLAECGELLCDHDALMEAYHETAPLRSSPPSVPAGPWELLREAAGHLEAGCFNTARSASLAMEIKTLLAARLLREAAP